MRIAVALFGALLSALLLLVLVDIYSPGESVLEIPLLVIFFVIWSVGFGYATVESNLKKKIIAVLMIEGIALIGSALYFIIVRKTAQPYLLGLTAGVIAVLIPIILRDKSE